MVLKFTTKTISKGNHIILKLYTDSKRYVYQSAKEKYKDYLVVSWNVLERLLRDAKADGFKELHMKGNQDEA